MAFSVKTCGRLQVTLWLHTSTDPSAAEWQSALHQITKMKSGVSVENIRALVITDGGAPNAVQRGELNDLLDGTAKTSAVTNVLSNRLKRGVATAISWINPNFRVFVPDQFGSALQHLDISEHQAALLASLRDLQKAIGRIETLALIEKAL